MLSTEIATCPNPVTVCQIILRRMKMCALQTFVRVSVAIGDLEVWVILSSIVVSELYDSLTVGPVLVTRNTVWAIKGQEIQAEFILGVVNLVDQ